MVLIPEYNFAILRSNLTSLVDESYHNFFLLLEFQSTFSNLMFSYQMSNKIIIEIELLVIFLFSLSRKRRRKKKLKFSTSPKRFDFSPLSFFFTGFSQEIFLNFFFRAKIFSEIRRLFSPTRCASVLYDSPLAFQPALGLLDRYVLILLVKIRHLKWFTTRFFSCFGQNRFARKINFPGYDMTPLRTHFGGWGESSWLHGGVVCARESKSLGEKQHVWSAHIFTVLESKKEHWKESSWELRAARVRQMLFEYEFNFSSGLLNFPHHPMLSPTYKLYLSCFYIRIDEWSCLVKKKRRKTERKIIAGKIEVAHEIISVKTKFKKFNRVWGGGKKLNTS